MKAIEQIPKVTASEIQRWLMVFVKGGYDVVLPNFYFGRHECDLFRITQSDFVFEYEIKISRADFFADFKKDNERKHLNMKSGDCGPNRFFFVVPNGLVKKEEVPPYAGLIYYDGGRVFSHAKSAKLLHKNNFKNYRSICHTLSERDAGHRQRIRAIRKTDYEKEINQLKRELEAERKIVRDLNFKLMLSKRHPLT